jgi:hypothetical protein
MAEHKVTQVLNKQVSRRDFLKGLAAVFAFFSLGGLTSLFGLLNKDGAKLTPGNEPGKGYGRSAYGGYSHQRVHPAFFVIHLFLPPPSSLILLPRHPSNCLSEVDDC